MKVRISRPGQRDLAGIRSHVLKRWDRPQWLRHHARLVACPDQSGDDPFGGHERTGLAPALRCLICGSHLIFWRPASGEPPFILRIRHGRRHLAAPSFGDDLIPR